MASNQRFSAVKMLISLPPERPQLFVFSRVPDECIATEYFMTTDYDSTDQHLYSDEVLRRKAVSVTGIDATIEELFGNMFETMYNAPGIGLAAPQVGRSLRLLVVDISCIREYENVKRMVVINPRILNPGDTRPWRRGA